MECVVLRFNSLQHVGGYFSEKVVGQTAAPGRPASRRRLLLPHGERCLRIPTETDREAPQVSGRPNRSPESRSVWG